MSGYRLGEGGRCIDRSSALRFTFEGRHYGGFRGDTLASALIANGVGLVARSFKYHRPRGIFSAGAEEPSALVQLGRGGRSEPNLRATQVELFHGLAADPVNAWPGLRTDLGALNRYFAPLLVAGFYYKTFLGPAGWWRRIYEPAIRRMAGMGRAPAEPDPDIYDHMHVHADVLVVGGGPAGLAAARAAAAGGARVVLAEDGPIPGASLIDDAATVESGPGAAWADAVAARLAAMEEVTVLRRTTVLGLYDHGYVTAVERRTDHLPPGAAQGHARQRLWHVRARRIVLATGAHERPMVFPGNDLPGVMLAGAVRAYLRRWGVACGRRAVVFAGDDAAYETAVALADAGVAVVGVVDPRPTRPAAAEAVVARGIPLMTGHAVIGAGGGGALESVHVAALDGSGGGSATRLHCDLLAVSGGWSPVVHLHGQLRGRVAYDPARVCFVPTGEVPGVTVVGAAAGSFSLAQCLAEGHDAGIAAAGEVGFPAHCAAPRTGGAPDRLAPAVSWHVPAGRGGKAFVDLQNDVTADDVALAAREGFTAIEHLKRYTTTGMGTDQGKTGNVNAIGVLAGVLDRPMDQVGTTTFRPPYTPVSYGALAGRFVGELFDPERVTPIHPRHVAAGAVFENVGQWKRPRFFPRAGEDMEAAVLRECRIVRETVGAMDASTLGKIEVRGPDAALFLDRIYCNPVASLAVGGCRYGVMCREDGMVFDDGVAMRLAPDRFLVTTTTGGAARVLDWMEEWLQTEWPELRVFCTSVTEQWSTVAVAGPAARAVVASLAPDLDVSAEGFGFMTFRDATVAGIPARVARISFSGELAFELNVDGTRGMAMWDAVLAAGAPFGIAPYGTEAMHVLRAEKGYFIVGHETDGTVTPIDLGLERMVARRKDFLGKRSLARSDTTRADRKQLVALLPDDPALLLPEGAQLVDEPGRPPPVPMIGHVTSSYRSAALGRTFALALVKGGRARIGTRIHASLAGGAAAVRIADPVLVDPGGSRRDG